MGGRPAGGQGRRAGGQRRRKYFTVIGDVCPYGGAYQGGTEVQTGDGKTYQVRNVQHLEWIEQGCGIGTSRVVSGKVELLSYTGDETHQQSLCAGV